jgi:ion channel POLLUX/CASTOR
MELKENVVVERKKTKNVTNRNNENNEKKYSVETQKILRQSTFDQLQIQRRLELLNKKETNRVGCCRKRINSLFAYMKYKFTTAWTDDVLKIDICKNVSLAIGYPCGFKFLFLVFAVLLLTGMFAVFLVIMKIIDVELFGNIMPDETDLTYTENYWIAWTYIADPGTHADENTPMRRIAAFIVAYLGVMFMSAIIGIVSTRIMELTQNFKLGITEVQEEGHKLILGWNGSTLPLIEELCLAADSDGGGKIVILSERPKLDVDNDIRINLGPQKLRGTRVQVRTGPYSTTASLETVQASKANSIIVQAAAGDPDKADSLILRTILSLKGMPNPIKGNIIAEMRDIDNQLLVRTVGGHAIETIVSHDIIGRLMIKSARNPGLAEVYESILGFQGCEFYMDKHPELTNMHWGDLYKVFEGLPGKSGGAIPIGIHRPSVFLRTVNKSGDKIEEVDADGNLLEEWQQSSVMLNPSSEVTIHDGDEIIVVADDDDSYGVNLKHLADKGLKRQKSIVQHTSTDNLEPEIILMCGWRRDLDDIIRLLNELTSPNSELHMINTVPLQERKHRFTDGGLELDHEGIKNELCDQLTENDEPAYNYTLRECDQKGIIHPHAKPHLKLIQWYGNASVRRQLREVELGIMARKGITGKEAEGRGILHTFDSVLILSEEHLEEEPMHSDSHALATLLLIRELQDKYKIKSKNKKLHPSHSLHQIFGRAKMLNQSCIITCEILDPRTRNIISNNPKISQASDYILSTHIVSKVLAMVAERREIFDVLNSLLGPNGAEVTLMPVGDVTGGRAANLTFRELQRRVMHKKSVLLGFQQFGEHSAGKLELAPKEVNQKKMWFPQDTLVTLHGRLYDLSYLKHFECSQQTIDHIRGTMLEEDEKII